MASKDEREFDSGLTGGTDVPASEEDFSLEEILAEYGAGREQRLLADVEQEVRREAEPAASVPEPAPQEPSPKAEARQKPAAPSVYGYTGEFFFDAFEHCGDHGSYKDFKDATGIGFSPYIYHAIQYNFTDYFAVESGGDATNLLI